jgi:hypothetical protein
MCTNVEPKSWANHGWPDDDDPWGSSDSWASSPPPLTRSSSERSLSPLPEEEASKLLLQFALAFVGSEEEEEGKLLLKGSVLGLREMGTEEDPIVLV